MVTTHFPPSVGGVERHVLMLSKALIGLGCDVLVYTQTPGPPEVEGVPVARVRRRHKLDGWLHCLRRLGLFRRASRPAISMASPAGLSRSSLPT